MQWHRGEYCIDTDKSKLDIHYIHQSLSNTYWAKGIPEDIVQRSIDGSLCFAVYKGQQQIGFARVITDMATFGYLSDVFIDPAFQGEGLGKWLVEVILGHPDLQGFRRFMLATADAHGLYSQFGFSPLNFTERWMHIHWPDCYRQKNQ